MKKRLLFLALTIIGALLRANQFPPHIDVLPFPAANAKVRLELPVRFAGDYQVEITMPNIDNKLDLGEETFPCDFLVSVGKNEHQAVSQHVESISVASEFGWGNTQTFDAGSMFHLGRGTYDVTITGGACPVAASRGASITVSRFETEHILGALIYWVFADSLILVGLVGLLFSELAWRPNRQLRKEKDTHQKERQ